MPWTTRLMFVLIGVGFMFAASCVGFIVLEAQQRELQTLGSAAPVSAVVVSTGINETQSKTANSPGTLYEGLVTYKYSYKGTDYESSQRNLTHTTTGIRSWAENDIAAFKPGQQITAWVDTNNPANAVLSRSVSLATYAIAVFLSLFVFLGAEMIMMGLVGAGERVKATQVQETFFDLPVLVWAGVICSQIFSYFSNASAPYPVGIYVYLIITLAIGAFFVRCRLVARGLVPAFGARNGNQIGPQNATIFDSGKRAGRSIDSSGYQSQGFEVSNRPRNYNQQIRAVGPGGQVVSLSPGQTRAVKLVNGGVLLAVLGFFIFRLMTAQNAANEALANINPERRDVKSEQQAKADIDRYDKLVQQQPDFNSYKQRGINYFGAEQYDKAIADLSKAIDESQPPDQQALIYRAHAYILTGQWAEGLAAHKQYLQIYNSSWDRWFAHRGMGICLYHQKQYQAAADSFTEALKEDADMEYLEKQELLYDRAMANEHLGKADLAAKDRKQVSAKNTKWWLK